MALMNLITAINHTLDLALAQDERVVVFGEDVGVEGGVFRATVGLQKNTARSGFSTRPGRVGHCGHRGGHGLKWAAAGGGDPVFRLCLPGLQPDHLPCGQDAQPHPGPALPAHGHPHAPWGGIKALEHHSESLDTFFGHIPGLKVVVPSTPYDAKGCSCRPSGTMIL